MVNWRRNHFKIPWGSSGKEFVQEMSRLLRAFSEGLALSSIALKAAMLLPSLVLQRPQGSSRSKELAVHLARRLRAWHSGDFNGLLTEGRVIQNHLNDRSLKRESSNLAANFSKLMMQGKTKAALRLLSDEGRGQVLSVQTKIDPHDPLSPTVLDSLKEKHPPLNLWMKRHFLAKPHLHLHRIQ